MTANKNMCTFHGCRARTSSHSLQCSTTSSARLPAHETPYFPSQRCISPTLPSTSAAPSPEPDNPQTGASTHSHSPADYGPE